MATAARALGPCLVIIAALALMTAPMGCTGDVQPTPSQDVGLSESGVPLSDTASGGGEAGGSKPGDSCDGDDCGSSDLLCYQGTCRRICSGDCGDVAPECAAGQGCYSVTSFAAACLPTSGGKAGDACDGASCAPGAICVEWGGRPPRCLARCPGGGKCAQGFRCGKTNQGCEVCHP